MCMAEFPRSWVGWGEIKEISNKGYQGTVYGLNHTRKGAAALELVVSLFLKVFWPGLQKQKLSQTVVGDSLALSESLD